jgi:hypothetical protein
MVTLRKPVAQVGLTLAALALASIPAFAQMKHMTDAEMIEHVKGSAPPAVLDNATILNMAVDGKMAVARKGTNGWTCMDPGGAPMCADAGAMEWAQAYMSKGAAPQKLGFIYMLRGDNGASNTDPHATGETPDNNWVKTGSHVMIVGAEAKGMLAGYPHDAKADPHKPYIMWAGTPYEHLMLPVQ